MADQDIRPDGTVAFLPHRLNRHPVVVRGLTADELWICAGLSAVAGLLTGIPLAFALSAFAVAPTAIVLAIALGVFAGGGMLRRLKRGRPDTWLYRQIQWWVAVHQPSLAHFIGGRTLVTRSGFWATRRSEP
ncbi:putative uncharacterized protein [Xanthomonas citri pv. mangiferaeindicae LMG 941]|uniref:TIGR03750 family conjugal transfer protein n=1 Tax=Xanthomonas citri TaxID=346 RepID=UPI0002552C97|nr:TIGR03750 family conjugal transfer protein [Xanthomonas citri]CCG36508.1 putative uncharacterized protein [Xanthomonas citri pv. mangiferaeindicae LMG 941]